MRHAITTVVRDSHLLWVVFSSVWDSIIYLLTYLLASHWCIWFVKRSNSV